MAKATGIEKAQGTSEGASPPYAPSWVDRFNLWIAQLPGPGWLPYVGLGFALLGTLVVVLWAEGVYSVGPMLPSLTFMSAVMPFFLALHQTLDTMAGDALATMRPALKASEGEYQELCYRLTTLPERPVLLASLLGAVFAVLVTLSVDASSSFSSLAASPVSTSLIYGISVLALAIAGPFVYHTVHQLRQIHEIYIKYSLIDLYKMGPLHGFSKVTALTAASLAGSTYGWYALNADILSDSIALGVALPITALALVTFVWPLLGVHRLLVEEKERMLAEASSRFEAATAELHQRLDRGELAGMDELNKAIASLEIELNVLSGIPTWPWRPETLRLFVTALALPLGLWLAQYVLQRILGP